jgi:hydrogenase/urease accessory protein HupE
MRATTARPFSRHIQMFFSLALLVFLGFFATIANAHAFKTSTGLVNFLRADKAFTILIDVNLEAIMAGINPEVKDTSESPNAKEYDRLRALSGADLEKEYQSFKETLLNGMNFELDGKPVHPMLTEETFIDLPDLTKSRNTTLKFRGDLPDDAKVFTFSWSPKFGKMTLRTIAARARSSYIEVLSNGATSTPLIIDNLVSRSVWDMIGDFMFIGFHHIVPEGIDHMLFVTGIFLLSTKWRPILKQVTAFTAAHTLTLGLSTLGVINLPASIVEPLIAASIVYVAVENILLPTLSPWRPVVVFMFGLLHGLGFAGALKDIGIPKGEFITGLLSFNVGVELGQLTVIAVCYLLVGIWFGNKPWYRQRIVIPGSLAIAAIATYWFFERVFFA